MITITFEPPERCLSVVMPCYNEENTVADVITKVLEQPCVAEVVVVNDGSTDKTAEILDGFIEPRLRVIHQPFNMGKGAALQRGFLEAGSEFVIVQDADLEYDPEEYPVLLQPLVERNADVVYGSRFLAGGPHRVLYYWHSVGNRLLTLMSNIFTNINLTDMETCYKAFRREVLETLTLQENRFGIEPEMTAKIAAGGWSIWEVGISYSGRTYEEGKKIGFKDALRAGYCVVRYSQVGERLARSRASRARDTDLATHGLHASLSHLAEADGYADYLVEQITPWVSGTVHEIGAGVGTIAVRLAERGHPVIASDPGEVQFDQLEVALASQPESRAVLGDLEKATATETADTVLLCNVLEHIEDDVGALRKVERSLTPGGRVILLVPAHEALYGEFDRSVGHYRRYRRSDLVNRLAVAGFHVEKAKYINMPGALLWWLWTRLLSRNPTAQTPSRLFNRWVTPVSARCDESFELPFGQSLLVIGRASE